MFSHQQQHILKPSESRAPRSTMDISPQKLSKALKRFRIYKYLKFLMIPNSRIRRYLSKANTTLRFLCFSLTQYDWNYQQRNSSRTRLLVSGTFVDRRCTDFPTVPFKGSSVQVYFPISWPPSHPLAITPHPSHIFPPHPQDRPPPHKATVQECSRWKI
jgi:hypothetical protein